MLLLTALALGASIVLDRPVTIDTAYSGRGYYRYCPTVLDLDGTRHVFYCRNRNAYSVVDHICHATVSSTGELKDETLVLSPSDTSGTGWDSYHVCDPSVIAGRFLYEGHAYRYLMAYLGVKGRTGDSGSDGAKCVNNKVGLAVSDALDRGWVRMGASCVVESPTPGKWGVGQPSLVSLDGAGKVALFYAGDGGTRVRTLNFSTPETAASSLVVRTSADDLAVSTAGIGDLKGLRESGVTITNGDFAYNRENGCWYLLVDTPDRYDDFYDPGDYGLSITKAVSVYRAAAGELSVGRLASVRWEKLATIRPEDLSASFETAFRIHNAGLVRTPQGGLAATAAFVSVAHQERQPLYTYRFQSVTWGTELDWFDAGLGLPAREAWGGAWSTDDILRGHALELDGPDTRVVGFRSDRSRRLASSGRLARVSTEVVFEYESDLCSVAHGTKGGLVVHGGSYWGVGADPQGGLTNVWRRLQGAVPALDTSVAVTIEVRREKRGGVVSYQIAENAPEEFPIVLGDSEVSTVTYQGNGTVESLVGKYRGDRTLPLVIQVAHAKRRRE